MHGLQYYYRSYVRRRKKKRSRRYWCNPFLRVTSRNQYGAYATVFQYFEFHDHVQFFQFTRFNVDQFDELYNLVADSLRHREPIAPEVRLAVVLKYLIFYLQNFIVLFKI